MSSTQNRSFWTLPMPTKSGVFIAEFSLKGLARLEFPRSHRERQSGFAEDAPESVRRWGALAKRAVCAALQGVAPDKLPPLDWAGATSFQRQVWRALLDLQPGATISYGSLARRIARPGAARAVGAACGANPVPVFVPCHRVLAADGGLGGFSGGMDWKRKLLAAERAEGGGGESSQALMDITA